MKRRMDRSLVFYDGEVVHACPRKMVISGQKIPVIVSLDTDYAIRRSLTFHLAYQAITDDIFICLTNENGNKIYLQTEEHFDTVTTISPWSLNNFLKYFKARIKLEEDGLMLDIGREKEERSVKLACNQEIFALVCEKKFSDQFISEAEKIILLTLLDNWETNITVHAMCDFIKQVHRCPKIDLIKKLSEFKHCPQEAERAIINLLAG